MKPKLSKIKYERVVVGNIPAFRASRHVDGTLFTAYAAGTTKQQARANLAETIQRCMAIAAWEKP